MMGGKSGEVKKSLHLCSAPGVSLAFKFPLGNCMEEEWIGEERGVRWRISGVGMI